MLPTPIQSSEADARGASRSSLYLSAVLCCDGFSSPVKIRNLSSSGALIEGPIVAASGSFVQLVRGGLNVGALVVWSGEGKCGLKFSDLIDLPQWRAAPTNVEQQRVDEIVRLVKAGAVPLPVRRSSAPTNPEDGVETNAAILGDLRRASELLGNLGDMLTSDPDVVARHGTALQNLDIAMQVIAAAKAVIAGQSDPEVDATKLEGLRRSADQALQSNRSHPSDIF